MSLRELARRAGTSHATLSAYEKGVKTPSTSTFVRHARAQGCLDAVADFMENIA
ncbi:MAG: helix-turn-helix transcriptional regulator [Pseudomonadales bacterium]|nr:helix-turn-helix transcriptional regulator [Pseudomonadales bacterium]MDP6470248.1 helix-turn-helix transcriptional regulator [Pseudomonadales bacterium]MDP6827154.1 helix-turn-helix transcriptional regulator [Pseudomonadales bacterium]MDP6971754.1 helix-turn-helix transcriptional regulator [Pseudomonadales bacterium]